MPDKKKGRPGLFLRVVDEKQRFIKTKTTVTLERVRGRETRFAASSRAGTATEFLLDVVAGDYDLTVAARSYVRHRSRISVARKESRTIDITLYEKRDDEETDAVGRANSWFSDIRAFPGKLVPVDARIKALKKKKRRPKPEPGPPPSKEKAGWTVLGPRNLSGRVRALVAHPTDGETIYAGSANAGVWITNNSGQSWRSLWFDEDVLEIGALAIHLTDPNKSDGDVTLYAGTGTVEFHDPTIFPAYPGNGIYKSTKNGRLGTWENKPVPLTDITAIVVDPESTADGPDNVVLYAGGSGGLFESKDGGSSWTNVLSGNVRSLALDPSNSQFLYAGVGGAGILQIDRTTLADADFNKNNAAPYPTSMMVVIGQSSPFTMYAKYDNVVHRFNRDTNEWESLGAHGGDTYGFWNECLAVDPKDSKIVISGGTGLERSIDSGATWEDVTIDSDHHDVAFSSSDSLIVYVGNDHGVRKGIYSAPDSGWWKKSHNGLILMHYNGLGASGIGPNVIGGGAQDNGTHRTVGGLTWEWLRGGDGGAFLYDPDDPYTMYYAESYALGHADNGDIYRTVDGGVVETQADTTGFQGPFVTPMAIDPDSVQSKRVLFAGGVNKVQMSTDGGLTWSASSPTLGGEIRSLSISASSSAVVFAGTHNGEVWLSTNGGATTANWKKKTPGTGVTLPNRRLTSVLADPSTDFGVFVTFGGLNSATLTTPGHLFYGLSKDGVDYDWQDLSGDLPDIPCYSVAIDPNESKRMWIGTDIGVFESNDGATTWVGDDGLPNVVVTELQIRREKDVLRAATYGWGMWQRRIQPPFPEVDIYVRSNKMDTGETSPCPYDVPDPQVVGNRLYFWESPDIKVRTAPPTPTDGVEFDELLDTPVVRGMVNLLYVQVHNRGWKTATNVKVKALWAGGAAGLPALPNDFWSTFPEAWSGATDWKPVDSSVPFQTIPKLHPHTPVILQWLWFVPQEASDDSCVLVVVSSDEDPVDHSDANPDDLIVDPISAWDKHIAHRNLQVSGVPASGQAAGGSSSMMIELNNPFDAPDFFSIDIDRGSLPKRAKVEVMLPKTGASHKSERVLIRGRSKVIAKVSLSLPNTVKPGDEFRFSVIQRRKGEIMGGNTYVIRVPPVVVRVSSK